MRTCLITLAVTLLCAPVATANTYYVLPDGSGDFPTIQQAIDACVDADEVLLGVGVFTGPGNRDLSIAGKVITVRSMAGPQNSIIDCEGAGRGFVLEDGFVAAKIQGITIRNGEASGRESGKGGGIYCRGGYLNLSNCTLDNNHAGFMGGGIFMGDCLGELYNDIMRGNISGLGGAVTCDGGGGTHLNAGTMSTNLYRSHGGAMPPPTSGGGGSVRGKAQSASGPVLGPTDRARAARSLGLKDLPTETSIMGILFDCNAAWVKYDDLYVILPAGGDLVIRNSLMWRTNGLPQFELESGITCHVDYCDVLDGESGILAHPGSTLVWGVGNIDRYPEFVNPGGPDGDPTTWPDNDYRLGPGSPGEDAGDPGYIGPVGATDLDGHLRVIDSDGDGLAIIDMGPYERLLEPVSVPSGPDRPPAGDLFSYPNPFNPTTTITFTLERMLRLSLTVHDMAGRHVTTLADRTWGPGPCRVVWNGLDERGNEVASGVYIVRASGEGVVRSAKVLLDR